ncbi:hypothetical protein DICPUDRAFT_42077 [Dictyostelium purpureum]|uniref:Presequence translocated-associated motor subunit PAM16 n=1 Tax=Dictyostelium purpureum TaxID=5786 RepID=F1A1C6_DICPU|nr:uncharacterized protein DICPUDRAFT_42077 [Dictyostelium purpureum]EGC30002.1 hypothetical protein DICPUDRAFT_42077 [Dictyostelium purpureum]|eukprot:XP_003293468.1 hypothetical protein DICPUDRAFT_42077 [Dictyostelium purpureum]
MAAKLLAKIIFTTGSVLVRSVTMAYKQAILQAENGMGAAAANLDVKSKMSPIEAKKILGLDNKDKFTIEDIENKHKELIDINNPKQGGSEYLQIKISGAKLCLINELKNK